MRILILQPWISYRGAETVSVNQCFYLNKSGHTAKIVAIFIDEKRLPFRGRQIGYLLPPKYFANLCKKYPFFLLTLGPLLLFFLVLKNISDFDILNPHNLPTVWIAAIIGKIFNKKIIWTCHSVPKKVFWRNRKSFLEYIYWFFGASWIDYICVRQTDIILAGSIKAVNEIETRYGRKARLIYPPLGELREDDSKLPEQVLELKKKSRLLLLQVGNLHSQKRQILTLRAMQELEKDINPIGVVFIGDGPDREFLEQECKKLNLTGNVFFTGYIPQKAIGSYYKICDLNLLPSVCENFGLSVIEALSYGKISVVSRTVGASDVLSDFILICNNSSADLASNILDYYHNRKYLQKKAVKGKLFVSQNFSLHAYCENFIQIAQNLSN